MRSPEDPRCSECRRGVCFPVPSPRVTEDQHFECDHCHARFTVTEERE